MSDVWNKDPNTGRLYQDRKEGGRTVRYTRDDPRESSANRGEASSSLRDAPTHRSRRDSVISSGSIDNKSSRFQPRHGTSSKRETSVRLEDRGRQSERSDAATVSDSRAYDRQAGPPTMYGDTQIQSSYRHGERQYHSPGGYNAREDYASIGGDPSDNLVGRMQNLTTDDNYTHVPVAASQATTPGNTASTVYGTSQQNPAFVDYGQTNALSPTLPSTQNVRFSGYIKGTPGDRETLDKSYQVRNHDYKKFFRRGRVFSTLWTEGVGNNIDNKDQTFVSEIVYKEHVYSKVRRFVIVREGDRSVTCLPVTSYDGAGHKKRGIRLEEHGFMHSKTPPKKVDRMFSKSLKVYLSKGAGHIKDPSLVNYGKVYNVEMNVKVKDIGELDADSKAVLNHYWRKVFVDEPNSASEILDTPRQGHAMLAHVGGAAYDTPATSEYSATSEYFVSKDYAPSRYPLPLPTGYATTQVTQPPTYNSAYQTNLGPAYSAGNAISGDAPARGYSSTLSGVSDYNTTQSYYPPDARYTAVATSPAATGTYAPNHSVPVTPRTYSMDQTVSRNIYPPSSDAQVASSGGDYYSSYQTNDNRQPSYPTAAVGDVDGDIRLPTVEEERRRRESNAGTSRSDRRRRHH